MWISPTCSTNISGKSCATLAETKAAGAATINYGVFVNTVLDFIIVAFVIFLVIRQINRLQNPAPATNKDCPYCSSSIPIKATRCPHYTSEQVMAEPAAV